MYHGELSRRTLESCWKLFWFNGQILSLFSSRKTHTRAIYTYTYHLTRGKSAYIFIYAVVKWQTRHYNYRNVGIKMHARNPERSLSLGILPVRRGYDRPSGGSGTETGWSSFKQSEDVSQIRRTCVRRRTRGACAATSKFLRAARAESLIS